MNMNNNEVYLVMAGYSFEGDDVMACLPTRQEADAIADKYREHCSYHTVYVQRWEIGEIINRVWEK